jgi:hypothetical protein
MTLAVLAVLAVMASQESQASMMLLEFHLRVVLVLKMSLYR